MWSSTVKRSGPEPLTLTGDERIESRLGEIVDGIVDGIVAAIKPRAVFATGSLAKGELTARIADGRVELISDLEIAVVDGNWFKGRRVSRLERDLARVNDGARSTAFNDAAGMAHAGASVERPPQPLPRRLRWLSLRQCPLQPRSLGPHFPQRRSSLRLRCPRSGYGQHR